MAGLEGNKRIRFGRVVFFALVLALVWFCILSQSYAALPGKNGPLFLSASPGSSGGQSALFQLGLDDQTKRLSPPGAIYEDPSVSPNGAMIAFRRNPGDQLWLGKRTNVASARQFTFDLGFPGSGDPGADDPSFAPDGKSIYYASYRGDDEVGPPYGWQLAEYEIASRTRRTVVDQLEAHVSPDPAVSPNGALLAFSIVSPGDAKIKISQLPAGDVADFPSPIPARSPDFSPNGKSIVFLGKVDGIYQVFVSDLEGDQVKQLTEGPGVRSDPKFSPDGRFVAYVSGLSENQDVVVQEIASGKTSRLSPSGSDVDLTEWGRAFVFEVRSYVKRNRRLTVRTFNPGTLKISGPGVARIERRVGKLGATSFRLRWTSRRTKSKLRIRFAPQGALAVTKFFVIRR